MSGTSPQLTVHTESVGSATIVHLRGEVDVATADQVTEAVAHVAGSVVLDLSGVSFMDSSGVRALVETKRAAEAEGQTFAIACPSSPVARLLDLIDLRSHFTVLDELPGTG